MSKIEITPKQLHENQQKLIKIFDDICQTEESFEILQNIVSSFRNISFPVGMIEFTTDKGKKIVINRENGELVPYSEKRSFEIAKIRDMNIRYRYGRCR